MTSSVTNVTTAVADLVAALPGKVVVPSDEAYEQQRNGLNLNADQRPVAVVHVADVSDVVTAVRHAAATGLAVTAQPVGHGATAAATGVVLLRTRGLDGISVDPQRRVARVGAGVKWGELLAATAPHGLVGLAGSTGDTTVVGFCLNGGLSWFGRKYGVAAHHIVSVDLVDATGTLRHVDAQTDPDLFWAVRGGGGEFGIVTAIEIELFEAPHIYGGRIMWPIDMAQPVLREYERVTANAPEELTVWAHVLRFPPLPFLPEFLRGKSFVSIEATYLGSTEEAEKYLAPFRTIPAVAMDSMGTVAIDALESICAEPTDPMPVVHHTALLTDLDGGAVDALLSVVGRDAHVPLPVVQLRHLGGAFERGDAADGPNGAISEQYNLFALGALMGPGMAEAIEATFVQLAAAMAPHESGRQFYTFMEGTDPTQAFSPAALHHLRSVKHAVDPSGTFRGNRPL